MKTKLKEEQSIPVSQMHCSVFTVGSFQRNNQTKLEEFGISLVVGIKKKESKKILKGRWSREREREGKLEPPQAGKFNFSLITFTSTFQLHLIL